MTKPTLVINAPNPTRPGRPRNGRWGRWLAASLTLGMAWLSQPVHAQNPAPGSFGAYELSLKPVAFWQLNETNSPAAGTVQAYDYTGNGFNGTYGVDAQNGYSNILGPQPPTYAGFATNQGALLPTVSDANSSVTLPPLNLNTNAVTITLWIYPNGTVGTFSGLLMNRTTLGDAAGFGFGGSVSGAGVAELGYTWNQNGGTTWGFNSGLYPQLGNWSFAALVIQSNQANIYLDYLDQNTGLPVLSSAVNPIAHTAENFTSGLTLLGDDVVNGNAGDSTRVFNGEISDAAVYNSALNASQITALFSAGIGVSGFAPTISGQPVSQYVFAGQTAQFNAAGINGTAPISYQWTLNGVAIPVNNTNYTGVNSNLLTVLSVGTVNTGTYQLTASNPYGAAVSSNSTLNIKTPAMVGEWLTNGVLTDVSGYSPAGTHDAYDAAGNNDYYFTNDVPSGYAGESVFFPNGDDGFAINNTSIYDTNYDNLFDNQINNTLTVTVWGKNLPATWSPFVSKWGETEGGWQLREDGSSDGNDSCFTIRDGSIGTNILGLAVGGNPDDLATRSFPSADGKWHLYAGVFNAMMGIRSLYVDGVLAAQEINNVAYNLAPGEHLAIAAKDSPVGATAATPGDNFSNFGTDIGVFDVRIYNYALSSAQIDTLVGVHAPSIAGQPKSITAYFGQPAQVVAAGISGTPPLTYQWTLNGVSINNLVDSTNFSGANSNILTILDTALIDAGSYQVTVSNPYGTAVSSNATVAIGYQLLVGEWFNGSNSLADVSGYSPAGTHDGFDAAGNGLYSYVNDGPPGRPGNSLSLAGTAIAINNSATSDANYTNTYDDNLTNAFTLAFWAKGFPGGWEYFVSKNGDSGSPNNGWTLRRDGWYSGDYACWTIRSPGGTFTLGGGGYTWDSDDLGTTSINITNNYWHHYAGTYNQTTGIRSLYVDGVLAAQEIDNGAYNLPSAEHLVIGGIDDSPGNTFGSYFTGDLYDVRVYNYDLTGSQVAALAALPDPAVVENPQSTTGYIGLTTQLSAAAQGTAPITYQWQFNGANLVDGAHGGAIVTGSTSNVLTIADLTASFQGAYDVVVTGANGSSTSRSATLTVVPTVVPPATNLVGAWLTGAATLTDVSGYSPAGTHDGYGVNSSGNPANTYAFTNDVPPGAAGQSLWLYANNTAIAISNSATGDANYTNTFDNTINNSFTLLFWAKGQPGNWNPWVSKYGDNGVGWQLRNGNGNFPCTPTWTVRDNSSGSYILGSGPVWSTAGDQDDMHAAIGVDANWHFYAGTFDAPSGIRNLYVDGVLEAQEIGNVEYNLAPASHVAIGAQDQSGSTFVSFFTGEIYGVQIYDTALTPAEVQHFLLPSAPPKFNGPPVVANGQLVLQWSSGTLLQATNLAGPWVPSGATSPYTNSLTAPQLFFRLSSQ